MFGNVYDNYISSQYARFWYVSHMLLISVQADVSSDPSSGLILHLQPYISILMRAAKAVASLRICDKKRNLVHWPIIAILSYLASAVDHVTCKSCILYDAHSKCLLVDLAQLVVLKQLHFTHYKTKAPGYTEQSHAKYKTSSRRMWLFC